MTRPGGVAESWDRAVGGGSGRRRPEGRRGPRRPLYGQSAPPVRKRRPSARLPRQSQADVQGLRDFFLHRNDGFCMLQLLAQTQVFLLELFGPSVQRCCRIRLSPSRLGGFLRKLSLVPKLAPLAQVRGVETFAAQQSSDLTRTRASLSLLKNAQLVGRGEPSTFGFGHNLGIGRNRRGHRSRPNGGCGRGASRRPPGFFQPLPRSRHLLVLPTVRTDLLGYWHRVLYLSALP